MKKKLMTFGEFQRSGRNVRFNDEPDGHNRYDGLTEFGRVYGEDGDAGYIQLCHDGACALVILNEQHSGPIVDLEKKLYEFYCTENSTPTEQLFHQVQRALDGAEGLHGPIGIEYVRFMLDVIQMCQNRITSYLSSSTFPK